MLQWLCLLSESLFLCWQENFTRYRSSHQLAVMDKDGHHRSLPSMQTLKGQDLSQNWQFQKLFGTNMHTTAGFICLCAKLKHVCYLKSPILFHQMWTTDISLLSPKGVETFKDERLLFTLDMKVFPFLWGNPNTIIFFYPGLLRMEVVNMWISVSVEKCPVNILDLFVGESISFVLGTCQASWSCKNHPK